MKMRKKILSRPSARQRKCPRYLETHRLNTSMLNGTDKLYRGHRGCANRIRAIVRKVKRSVNMNTRWLMDVIIETLK